MWHPLPPPLLLAPPFHHSLARFLVSHPDCSVLQAEHPSAQPQTTSFDFLPFRGPAQKSLSQKHGRQKQVTSEEPCQIGPRAHLGHLEELQPGGRVRGGDDCCAQPGSLQGRAAPDRLEAEPGLEAGVAARQLVQAMGQGKVASQAPTVPVPALHCGLLCLLDAQPGPTQGPAGQQLQGDAFICSNCTPPFSPLGPTAACRKCRKHEIMIGKGKWWEMGTRPADPTQDHSTKQGGPVASWPEVSCPSPTDPQTGGSWERRRRLLPPMQMQGTRNKSLGGHL